MPILPLTYAAKLEPRYLVKPWGGRRIETVLRRPLPVPGKIGESWEVHDRDGASSVVSTGRLAGRTLAELRGPRPFPLLVKILDATERLSLQVHPDAEAAERHRGEPKTECWFVLHAEPGARVWRGLREGCTRPELEAALLGGDPEPCLHSFEVRAGNTVFVPAGTPHAIGAGVLLAEVQENSDTTWRLHDWGRTDESGRARELHVAQALDAIHYGVRSPDTVPMQVTEDEGSVRRVLLIRSRFFTVEHVTGMGTFTLEVDAPPDDAAIIAGAAPFQVLHVLSGEGELRPFDRRVPPTAFFPGDTVLLPPPFEEYEVSPGASIVRALLIRR